MSESEGSLTLQWTTPRRLSVTHLFQVPFLAFWLVGWAVGEVTAIAVVLSGRAGAHTLFMIAWLAAWSAGGTHALMTLTNLVRGPSSERVVLTERHLLHSPSMTWNWPRLFRAFRGQKSETLVFRHQLASLRVPNRRDRNPLMFDHGNQRIEIGTDLPDSDRAWLADVITAWGNDGGYR